MDSTLRKHRYICLHFCYFFVFYCSGLLLGIWFAADFSDPFVSLMHGVLLTPLTIVGCFISVFLPLLISTICWFYNRRFAFLLVCFFKAVAFGFVGMILMNLISAGDWLIQFLFLFPDLVLFSIQVSQWFRINMSKSHTVFSYCYYYLSFGILAAGIDYLILAPLIYGIF